MDLLPNEILSIILPHCDGRSIARSSQVCWKWYNVIKILEKGKPMWKSKCLEEIPEFVIEQLLGSRSLSSEPLVEWKEIYKEWFRGKMVHSWSVSVKTFRIEESPVTCLKQSGLYILTGHRNGRICAWRDLKFSHYVIVHLNIVNDMVLYDSSSSVGSYYINDDVWNHSHIISASKDHTLQAVCLISDGKYGYDDSAHFVYHHGAAVHALRLFNDKIVCSAADRTILVFRIDVDKEHVTKIKLSLINEIPVQQDIESSLGFWQDKIYYWLSHHNLIVHSLDKNIDEPIPLTVRVQQRIHFLNFYDYDFARMFFFNGIVVLLTVNALMLVSIDSQVFQLYYLMPTIQSTVISVAVRGSILALGTESGKLLLYSVPQVKQFMELNLSEPVYANALSAASIISIDIADDSESPVIAASTTDSVFFMKWIRKHEFRVC